MFKTRRRTPPNTTEECRELLEMILEFADSTLLDKQQSALKAVDRLCKKRCTRALTYIMREFSGSSLILKRQIVSKIRECL